MVVRKLAACAAFVSLLWLQQGASAQEAGRLVDARFFGMHFHNAGGSHADRPVTVLPGAPIGAWRIWDTRNRWADLEPARGRWRWESLDRLVDLAVQRGVEPLLVLGSTPSWASARPQEPCPYGSGCAAEPADLQDWENYVRAIAVRYKGRVKTYELWNEPKFSDFPQSRAFAFFTGSTAKMVELAAIASRVLKDVDRGNRLFTPGFTGSLDQVEHYLAAGGSRYADGVSLHFYVARPEVVLERYRRAQDIMRRHGLEGRPLWNTEQGFSVLPKGVDAPGPTGFGVPDRGVFAAYLQRTLVLQASIGVERVYWHGWESSLADTTGAPNEVGQAYLTVARWLFGSTIAACSKQRDGSVVACPLRLSDRSAWVVWRDGAQSSFELPTDWRIQSFERADGSPGAIQGSAVEVGREPVLLIADRLGKWGEGARR